MTGTRSLGLVRGSPEVPACAVTGRCDFGPLVSQTGLCRAFLWGPGGEKPRAASLAVPRPGDPQAGTGTRVRARPDPKRLVFSPQANLAFDPAALLPGASPRSPGLKAVVSPFHSPPSTPSSPGVRSRAGGLEEVPASFDQPPEGSHLPCYNKVALGPRLVARWWERGPQAPRTFSPLSLSRDNDEDTRRLQSGLVSNRTEIPLFLASDP